MLSRVPQKMRGRIFITAYFLIAKYGNDPNVHEMQIRSINFGIFIQWNVTQQ